MLRAQTTARFLVSSRARPRWANARLELYGDVLEIDRDTLAMDEAESIELVGRRGDPAVAPFLAQAQGWPAVLAPPQSALKFVTVGFAKPRAMSSSIAARSSINSKS